MQVTGYFSHVHSFPWEWTRASESNLHERQHAWIDIIYGSCRCLNTALAFFLEMRINDMQHLIWKTSLHKAGDAEPTIEQRISWSFAYDHLQKYYSKTIYIPTG